MLQASTVVGIVVLMALLLNIMNGAFGYAAVQNKVDPRRWPWMASPWRSCPRNS